MPRQGDTGGLDPSMPRDEPAGMKVPLSPDGSGVPVPLIPAEAAEMRCEYDEWDRCLYQLMDDHADFPHDRSVELRDTGTTTIREPTGMWTAHLERPPGRDGWLVSEGRRIDRSPTRGGTRITSKSDDEYLGRAVCRVAAEGLLWLREG
jgi:hypothetical protein